MKLIRGSGAISSRSSGPRREVRLQILPSGNASSSTTDDDLTVEHTGDRLVRDFLAKRGLEIVFAPWLYDTVAKADRERPLVYYRNSAIPPGGLPDVDSLGILAAVRIIGMRLGLSPANETGFVVATEAALKRFARLRS